MKKILLGISILLGLSLAPSVFGLDSGYGFSSASLWYRTTISTSTDALLPNNSSWQIGSTSTTIGRFLDLNAIKADIGTLTISGIATSPLLVGGTATSTITGDGTGSTIGGGLTIGGNVTSTTHYLSGQLTGQGIVGTIIQANSYFSTGATIIYDGRGLYQTDQGNNYVQPTYQNSWKALSGVGIGDTAVAYILDTANALSTSTQKLFSLKNNGTEKAYIDANGYAGMKTPYASINETTLATSTGSTITATNIGQFYVWTGASSTISIQSGAPYITYGISGGATSTITIGARGAGIYQIAFNASIQENNANQLIHCGVFKNDTLLQQIIGEVKLTTSNDTKNMFSKSIISLSANDVLDLRCSDETTAGTTIIFEHTGLDAIRISQ